MLGGMPPAGQSNTVVAEKLGGMYPAGQSNIAVTENHGGMAPANPRQERVHAQAGFTRDSIVLHNLDNDRIFGQHYVQHVLETMDDRKWRQNGGCVVHAPIPGDASSYGGIAYLATHFSDIGGYDESLPYPSGCQDTDMLRRTLWASGYPTTRCRGLSGAIASELRLPTATHSSALYRTSRRYLYFILIVCT